MAPERMNGHAAGWELRLVPDRRGRHAVLLLHDSQVVDTQRIDLVDAQERAALAAQWSAKTGWPSADMERELLALFQQIADLPAAEGETQVQTLLRLAQDAELFHTQEDRGWACVLRGEVGSEYHDVLPIRSKAFRLWLVRRYYGERQSGPSSNALTEALDTLEARALCDGPQQPVFLRVAPLEPQGLVLDLADARRRCVVVTPQGWQVADVPPVRFQRQEGMLPLPKPQTGGDLRALQRLLGLPEELFRLAVAWLLAALRPTGPYWVGIVEGVAGSGKSTLCKVLRGLIDPHVADAKRPPKDERDLFVGCAGSWVSLYDNLSGLSHELSDSLCMVATRGSYACRRLYTDDAQHVIALARPLLLNGIDAIARRGDLRDRALVLTLPDLDDDQRRDEKTILAEFEEIRPLVLGALLDATVAALRNWERVNLPVKPRMADCARWVAAAEGALPWPPGAFLETYLDQRRELAASAIEDDPLARAILAVVRDEGGSWEGKTSALLDLLSSTASEQERKHKLWPGSPESLGRALRRLAPDLKRCGVDVEFNKGTKGTRLVRLRAHEKENPGKNRHLLPPNPENSHNSNPNKDLSGWQFCESQAEEPPPEPPPTTENRHPEPRTATQTATQLNDFYERTCDDKQGAGGSSGGFFPTLLIDGGMEL